MCSSDLDVWASDTDYKSSHTVDGWMSADQDDSPPTFQQPATTRQTADGHTVTVQGVQVLVDGVDVADDFARSALVNPKDVLVDSVGRIMVACSGGVLVGDPQ